MILKNLEVTKNVEFFGKKIWHENSFSICYPRSQYLHQTHWNSVLHASALLSLLFLLRFGSNCRHLVTQLANCLALQPNHRCCLLSVQSGAYAAVVWFDGTVAARQLSQFSSNTAEVIVSRLRKVKYWLAD